MLQVPRNYTQMVSINPESRPQGVIPEFGRIGGAIQQSQSIDSSILLNSSARSKRFPQANPSIRQQLKMSSRSNLRPFVDPCSINNSSGSQRGDGSSVKNMFIKSQIGR